MAMREVAGWIAAAVLCVLPGHASATSISPVNIEMTTMGAKARAQIVMTNTSNAPLAVEPEVETTLMDEHGRVRHGAAGEEFLILPVHALIAPGASQVFRVQWVGELDLEESRSYLVTMNELPVRGVGKRTALGVTLSFGVAVNVAAANAKPVLSVVASGVKKDQKGRLRPFVVVENPTAAHALLKDAVIRLASNNWSSTIAPGSFEQTLGTGLVQPHHRREFLLPVNVPPGVRELSATVDLRP
jgi:P pilus assembly chaperone PapD